MPVGKQYRIGEFARLGATSIRTLRFYDDLGLLRPAKVDVRTRYRYYASSQLQDLAAIRALQDLGATLEDIRRVLTNREAGRERRQLLSRLRAEALRRLTVARRSLEWIELELEDADHGRGRPAVFLEQRGEVRIASIRARLASYADIAPVERDLHRAIEPSRAGELRGVLWHRCEASGAIEGEPFVELRGGISRAAGCAVGSLPGARVASSFCEPDDDAAMLAYESIDRWIHRHALRLDGPKREIYLGPLLAIQFPVRPA
jgi:DNA-binding transcriptional MerR regulator